MIETDEGTQYVIDYIQDYKGKNNCNTCGRKLGIINRHTIYERFGLKKWLCKDCYKHYKQIMKR